MRSEAEIKAKLADVLADPRLSHRIRAALARLDAAGGGNG